MSQVLEIYFLLLMSKLRSCTSGVLKIFEVGTPSYNKE